MEQSKKKSLPKPEFRVEFDKISKSTAKELKDKKGLSEDSKRVLSLIADSDRLSSGEY